MVAKIIRPLVIISSSNDSNLTNKGSLNSSHHDKSIGDHLMTRALIDHEIFVKMSKTCF